MKLNKEKKIRGLSNHRGINILMTLPALLVMLITVIYPVIWSLILSASDSKSVFKDKLDFVGLENYIHVLKSSAFYNALGNTLAFVCITIFFELLFGFIISLILNSKITGHKIFNLIFTLPLMIAALVSGLQWRWILADQYGALNNLLALVGVKGPQWLSTPVMAFISLIIANLWLALPFCIMVLLSALSSLPDSLNEAGKLDGAGKFQLFWYITLPQLKQAVLTILVIRIADAFRVFDIVYILTAGGPGDSTEMISNYIYKTSFTSRMFGEGAAASFICLLIILAICLALYKLMGKSSVV